MAAVVVADDGQEALGLRGRAVAGHQPDLLDPLGPVVVAAVVGRRHH
jgi:hypothetical protein